MTKPRTMPVHDGSRSDQYERLPPPGPASLQRNPERLCRAVNRRRGRCACRATSASASRHWSPYFSLYSWDRGSFPGLHLPVSSSRPASLMEILYGVSSAFRNRPLSRRLAFSESVPRTLSDSSETCSSALRTALQSHDSRLYRFPSEPTLQSQGLTGRLRAYWPDQAILDGTWKPPVIQAVK